MPTAFAALTPRRRVASLVVVALLVAAVLVAVHVVRCRLSVAAFERAYRSHPVPLGAGRLGYPFYPLRTLGSDLLLFSTDHSEVYRIDQHDHVTTLVTAPAGTTFLDLQAEGRWVLTMATGSGIDAFGNPPNTELALLDSATGRRTVLVHQEVADPTDVKQPRFDSPVLSHGSVFWVTRASGGTLRAVARRYVVRTGKTSDLGAMGGALGHNQSVQQVRPILLATRTGLTWGVGRTPTRRLVTWPAPTLPIPVQAAFYRTAAPDAVTYVSGVINIGTLGGPATDGTSYAWGAGDQTYYWTPGLATPRRFDVGNAGVVDVRGPVIAAETSEESSSPRLLDTRTGAVITPTGSFRLAFHDLHEGQRRLSRDDASLTALYRVPADLPRLTC